MSFHAKQQSQRQNHPQVVPLGLKSHHLCVPAPLWFSLWRDGAHGLSLREPAVTKRGWCGERGPPLSPGRGLRGQQVLGSDPLHLSFF